MQPVSARLMLAFFTANVELALGDDEKLSLVNERQCSAVVRYTRSAL